MLKRIFLFGLVNVAVIVTVSVILSVLGVEPYLTANGINYQSLLVFCAIWGMVGSFISLAISKWMAKKMMGVQIIPENASGHYGDLVRTVHKLAKAAGLPKMPEVGVYQGAEVNAFATGPSKSNSLVAVSTGLLESMNRDEVEGVLGHEVAHIANGDMVTMTLIQGVINAFVMFFARIAAFAVQNALRSDDEEGQGVGGLAYMFTTIIFEIIFGIIGSMITAWFSRQREFRADAGGAVLAGREKMIAALERLQRSSERIEESDYKAVAALKISGKPSKFMALFSTHPDLSLRISRLRSYTAN